MKYKTPMDRIRKLFQAGITDGVFPGAQLLVSRGGKVLFHEACGLADIYSGRPVTVNTRFDLASLTKPLATVLAVLKLVQQGKAAMDDAVSTFLPAFDSPGKGALTLGHLLTHTSGLPDYVPYYSDVGEGAFAVRKKRLRSLLAKTPLHHPVGEKTLYSDVGFMLLEWVVEAAAGMRLDAWVGSHVYAPLGLNDKNGLFFQDLNVGTAPGDIAATEDCPWRKRILCGEVHDENAWISGGIQGHAGLFGSAESVYVLLSALVSAYHENCRPELFPRKLVREFLTPVPGVGRTPGFDTPDRINSSSGKYFKGHAVGHLGFTGTSFWMDLDRSVIVILLTNRVHPSRQNDGIRAFRPRLHDAVMEEVVTRSSSF